MGVAILVPGFSFATAAIILGIYGRILEGVRGVISFSISKEDILFLFFIFFGILLSLSLLSLVIAAILEDALFRALLYSFFSGICLGSFHSIKRGFGKLSKTHFLYIFLGAFFFSLFKIFLIFNIFKPGLFISGVFASFFSFFPGISGSLILAAFGKYREVIFLFSSPLPFGIAEFFLGVFVGIYLFFKLIVPLLNKYLQYVLLFSLGLVICSSISIWPFFKNFYLCSVPYIVFDKIGFFSIICFIFGWLLFSNKNKEISCI